MAFPTTDRYAHLRQNLSIFRALTQVETTIEWCTDCGVHHAGATGLCPVCAPLPQAA